MLKKVMITKQLWVYVCGQKVLSISQEKQKRQKSKWKDKEMKINTLLDDRGRKGLKRQRK